MGRRQVSSAKRFTPVSTKPKAARNSGIFREPQKHDGKSGELDIQNYAVRTSSKSRPSVGNVTAAPLRSGENSNMPAGNSKGR